MKYSVILLLFCFYACTGCNSDLDLQQDYDFEVEMLPVPKTVELNAVVEIRFELKNIGGHYDSTAYYVRYFQYEGKGTLTDESGTTFYPNDSYSLTKKKFRLYFQPQKGENHNLELVFYDSFEHQKTVDLNFAIEQVETN